METITQAKTSTTGVARIAYSDGIASFDDDDFFADGDFATRIAGAEASTKVQTLETITQAKTSTTGVARIAYGDRFANVDDDFFADGDVGAGVARGGTATAEATTDVDFDTANAIEETTDATAAGVTGVTGIGTGFADGNVCTRLTRRDGGTGVTGTRTDAIEDTGVGCNRAANYEKYSEKQDTGAFHVENLH